MQFIEEIKRASECADDSQLLQKSIQVQNRDLKNLKNITIFVGRVALICLWKLLYLERTGPVRRTREVPMLRSSLPRLSLTLQDTRAHHDLAPYNVCLSCLHPTIPSSE